MVNQKPLLHPNDVVVTRQCKNESRDAAGTYAVLFNRQAELPACTKDLI